MACSLYPITLVSPSLSDPLQPITPSTSHITGSPHFIPAQIFAGTLSLRSPTLHPLRPLRRSIRHCSTAGHCCGGTSSLLPPSHRHNVPSSGPSFLLLSFNSLRPILVQIFHSSVLSGILYKWTAMISLSVYNICSSRKWPTVSSTSDPSYYYCSTLFGKFWTRFYTVQLWPAV